MQISSILETKLSIFIKLKGTCTSTQFWDSTNLMCVQKYNYSVSCTYDYQCSSNLFCDPITGCSCEYAYYWNPTTLVCTPQGKNGSSCNGYYYCRTDLGNFGFDKKTYSFSK